MRTFAILLLLLNLGFAAWQQGWLGERQAQTPAVIRLPFRQASQALVLLAELPAEQRALMDQIAVAEGRMGNARQQLSVAEQEVAGIRGQLAGDEAAPEAGGGDEAAPEAGRADESTGPDLNEAPALAAETAPAPVVPWCAAAGIFPDEQAADGYIAGLVALGARGERETRQETVASTWSVHMPPFAAETEARRMLAELQDKGIDSFYMRDGDMVGGISLGLFSREARAETARVQLERQGYAASIREIKRQGARVYVNIEVADSALLLTSQWADLQASVAALQVAEKLCEVIAQENVFP